MSLIIKRNPSPIPAGTARIRLGRGKFAIVDRANLGWLRKYRWFAKKSSSCWYAVRRIRLFGREHIIYMHREITGCPPGLVVHHHNHKTFDNREANLFPMTPGTHNKLVD